MAVLLLTVGAYGVFTDAGPFASRARPAVPADAGTHGSGHELSVTKLEIGDCFDVANEDAESVAVVVATACTDVHRFELFHVFTLPEGLYPGQDWFEMTATVLCRPVLERYTGIVYSESAIDFSWFYPDESAWIDGDRAVQCFAYDAGDSRLTASLQAEPAAEGSLSPSDSPSDSASTGPVLGSVHVRELRPGDCWTTDTWEPTELGNVTRISCGQRHQFEVVWAGTYTSDTFPTAEGEFLTYIDVLCSPAFEDYVGVEWVDSPFDIWMTYPSADRWLAGDRTLVCSAFDIDAPLSRSIKGELRAE